MKGNKTIWTLMVMTTVLFACKKSGNKDNPPEIVSPEITAFTPTHGITGTEVTITGKNFAPQINVTKVFFNDVPATVKDARSGSLTVVVPPAAVTGKIKVTVGDKSVTAATDFVVDPLVAITDFNPKSGPFGTEVTLTGRMFGSSPVVKINGVVADKTSSGSNEIKFKIPFNTSLTKHKITVEFDGTVLTSGEDFTVTAAGKYAEWVSRNLAIEMPALIFTNGLGFAYRNKLYWGFTAMSAFQDSAYYAVYDPAQHDNGWVFYIKPPVDMAPQTNQQVTAIVFKDKLYMGTGLSPTVSAKWWNFDPETNTATRMTDVPLPGNKGVAFIYKDVMYAGLGNRDNTLYSFDPAGNAGKGSWQSAGNLPVRESGGAGALVFDNFVVLGRLLEQTGQLRKAMFKFIGPGNFQRIEDLPDLPVTGETPSFVFNNKGYFVIAGEVWEYDPSKNTGAWRMVEKHQGNFRINYAAVVNNVILGWTNTGAVYELRFNP